MKKNAVCCLLAAVLLLVASFAVPFENAGAAGDKQTYTFAAISAQLTLDKSAYDVVLTPVNLTENTSWLSAQGMDPDATANSFEENGVFLEAYDLKNGRTLVVTALKDVDAQTYFDLNEQDDTMRRNYRLSHSDGSAYGLLGYDYASATWKNYGSNTDRFLRLKYTLTQGGELLHRGYQRRTIRNGYTITIDLQVKDRSLKTADEKLIDSVMSGFTFTEIKKMEETCKLTVADSVPKETSSESITLSGTTNAKATVTAAILSMTSSATATVTDTASSKGKYSLKVTFPEQGTFSLVLTAQTEDGKTTQKSYSITYQRNLLPVNLNSEIPYQLSGDELVISGTTISGAKTQVSVSGPVTYQKSKTSKSFSFTIDTSKEGTYQIIITVTKKGLDTRTLNYSAVRTFTAAESEQKIKDAAMNLTYKKLVAGLSKYAGKTFSYTGYILETRQSGTEWTIKLALSKSGSSYKDIVYLVTKNEPAFQTQDKVKMYGTLSEDPYIEVMEGSGSSEYPRFELLILEAAE